MTPSADGGGGRREDGREGSESRDAGVPGGLQHKAHPQTHLWSPIVRCGGPIPRASKNAAPCQAGIPGRGAQTGAEGGRKVHPRRAPARPRRPHPQGRRKPRPRPAPLWHARCCGWTHEGRGANTRREGGGPACEGLEVGRNGRVAKRLPPSPKGGHPHLGDEGTGIVKIQVMGICGWCPAG